MEIEDKITSIFNIVKDIEKQDQAIASILMEGLGLSINLIDAVIKNNGRKNIDITEHLEIVSSVLGVSLRELVMHIIQTQPGAEESSKEADAATLNFITSTDNLDDYEKFLAQTKAKEDLDFLAKIL